MTPLLRNDRPGQYPPSYYAATAELPDESPPLKGRVRADVCVIGGGFAGLTAAMELARAGRKVVLLEAHRPGFGASGRNGGQMGSGFNQSQRWLEKRLGTGEARALWDLTEAAKTHTREMVATHAPEAGLADGIAYGGWSAGEVAEIHEDAEHLRRAYGYEQIEPLDESAFTALVRSPVYKGGHLDRGAGHLHPLRYVLGLAKAAEAAGVTRHDRSIVHRITPGTTVKVQTDAGEVEADHLIVAGNGYLSGLLRPVEARTMAINSFIAATEPLGDRAAEVLSQNIAVADERFVVNYFRLSNDKRLLFGGRESYSIGFPKDITTRLRARMEKLFPQLAGVDLPYVWGGTLGITRSRLPLITAPEPNILSIGGFSGHGVALSGFTGKIAAEATLGQSERFDLFAKLPTPPFPGGAAFQAPLLSAAMTWYALRDRLGV